MSALQKYNIFLGILVFLLDLFFLAYKIGNFIRAGEVLDNTSNLDLRDLTCWITVVIFNMWEHEWMIAKFAQLHDGIHERLATSFPLLPLFRSVG